MKFTKNIIHIYPKKCYQRITGWYRTIFSTVIESVETLTIDAIKTYMQPGCYL